MVLARAWRRRLYGGIVAAAFVPAALVATLAALAVSGGLGQFGALAQALSGPPEPPAVPLAIGHPVSPRVLAALSPAAPVRTATTSLLGGRTHARSPARPVSAGGAPRVSGLPNSRVPRAGRPGGVAPVHHHPAPGRTPHPTLIDGVLSAGASTTSQLPAPAGSTAAQTLQSAGTTLDKILPPPLSLPKK